MLFSKCKTALLIGLGIGMILIPTSGSGQLHAPIEIEVYQREEELTFEFFVEETIFFIPYRARIGVSTLYVADPGEVIWSINSKPDLDAVARKVKYGVVPEGFYQEVPKIGDAPRLKNNTEYRVRTLWGGRGAGTTFIYQGK